VRILYARNLMMNTTEEQIKEILECFKPNSVERVTKLKDYAFVHFKERDDASHAMNLMNDRETDDPIAEVTLAKSVDKNQYFRFTRDVSPRTIAANSLFVLPTSAVGPRTTAFDFTSHLTAISYLIIPPTSLTTNPTPISTILASVINGTTVVSVTILQVSSPIRSIRDSLTQATQLVAVSNRKINEIISLWILQPLGKQEALAAIQKEHKDLEKKLSELL
ncbi:unnamed protein product, partial [Rotaria sordida]